jgi:hypothetical protein
MGSPSSIWILHAASPIRETGRVGVLSFSGVLSEALLQQRAGKAQSKSQLMIAG